MSVMGSQLEIDMDPDGDLTVVPRQTKLSSLRALVFTQICGIIIHPASGASETSLRPSPRRVKQRVSTPMPLRG